MLTEMAVSEVTLNELSRRVGLAKSNVLRYVESREAALLELLDVEMSAWADRLDERARPSRASVTTRVARAGEHLAASLAERPVLCDLISAQAAVLERNVSAEVALRHKRGIGATVPRLQGAIRRVVPELTEAEAYVVVETAIITAAGAWPQSQPSEAVLAAYAEDASVAAGRIDFADVMTRTVSLTITGLLADR